MHIFGHLMGYTQPCTCGKTCHGMCVCTLWSHHPSHPNTKRQLVEEGISQTATIGNIPNCHSQESHHYTTVKKELKPNSGHCSTAMTKMSCMKHSSGWVLLPLALLFSLFFVHTYSTTTTSSNPQQRRGDLPLWLVSQHLPEFVLRVRKPACQNQTESKNFPSQSAWANSQGELQQHLTG